jgi:hypothetical protein
MDPATLTVILQAATGAGGAVVVCLIVMVGTYHFVVNKLLPMQKESIDDLVKDSRANRKVFRDAVEVMSRRLDKVEDEVTDILGEVKHIKEKL